MRKSLRSIYEAFEGKLIGRPRMKIAVCEVLSIMPLDVIRYVTKRCWFFGSADDSWAFTFSGDDLAKQHMIFVSDELLMQTEKLVRFTIAHEIGHVVLKHRNSVLERQTKDEVRKQEKEADEFAKKHLSLD